MSEQAILYLSMGVGVVFVVATVAMIVGVFKMLTAVSKSGEQTAGQHAAASGWTFETSSQGGSIDRRWTGTTRGVPWTASYRAINNQTEEYRRHEFRWAAAITAGPASPILLVHQQSALAKLDAARKATPAFLSGLVEAASDKALDVFFGREAGDKVDLARLQTVEGHGLAGWQLMAQNGTEGLVLIERSLKARLAGHTIPGGAEAPVVLLLQDGVHLALRSPVSTEDLDGVVALGSSLAAAFNQAGGS
jgi:hypothetical protein